MINNSEIIDIISRKKRRNTIFSISILILSTALFTATLVFFGEVMAKVKIQHSCETVGKIELNDVVYYCRQSHMLEEFK